MAELDKIKIRLSKQIDKCLIDQKEFITDLGELMEITIEGYVWGEKLPKIVEISYPLNWWQAVKERFMPLILLKFFPIKYKYHKISFTELYPGFKFAKENNVVKMNYVEKVQ
jgi:hypothetical protein